MRLVSTMNDLHRSLYTDLFLFYFCFLFIYFSMLSIYRTELTILMSPLFLLGAYFLDSNLGDKCFMTYLIVHLFLNNFQVIQIIKLTQITERKATKSRKKSANRVFRFTKRSHINMHFRAGRSALYLPPAPAPFS
jgi:hypothetical protein